AARAQRDSRGSGAGDQDLEVHVIGCIRPSELPQQPAAGVVPAPEERTKYILSDVTLAADPERGADAPTTKSQLLAQAVKMYRLGDAAESKIAPHLGDRVEVNVRIIAAPSTPARPQPSSPSMSPKLRVESLRIVSSKSSMCSR